MSYKRTKRICWGLAQGDIDRLSATLRPVRSRAEVAEMMGVSVTLVSELEKSALSKLIRAINDYENNVMTENEEEMEEAVADDSWISKRRCDHPLPVQTA